MTAPAASGRVPASTAGELRRVVVRARLALLTCLTAFACAGEQRPSVVVILGDDLGWSDCGFMGHPEVRTPNLDRLAREGLCFARGYVSVPVCRPSLATIVNGLHAHQHCLTANDAGPEVAGRTPAERRAATIAHWRRFPAMPALLGASGFASFQTGKWWEGSWKDGGFGGGMTQGSRHGDEGLKIGRGTMEPALDFLDASKDKPFFLWYAPMLPHAPHNAAQELVDSYRKPGRTEEVARYYASCTRFDQGVGAILDRLDRLGIAGRTLVVFINDNGWDASQAGPGGDNHGGPQGKRTPYELGIRTPIILRRPGTIAPRMETAALAHAVDLLPTVLRHCGVVVPPGLPGIDLLDDAAVRGRDAVFGASYEQQIVSLDEPARGLVARWVVEGTRKLILRKRDGRAELFDLAADPGEKRDLAAEAPQEVARLRARLDAWWPGR